MPKAERLREVEAELERLVDLALAPGWVPTHEHFEAEIALHKELHALSMSFDPDYAEDEAERQAERAWDAGYSRRDDVFTKADAARLVELSKKDRTKAEGVELDFLRIRQPRGVLFVAIPPNSSR